MKAPSRFLVTVAAVLLCAVTSMAGVGPVPFRTGLFGVVPGQTVRISVLNAGDARGIINPCFKIWDAAGGLLFESDGEPLALGTGDFREYEVSQRPVPGRLQLRAELELLPVPNDGKGRTRIRRGDFIVTLEVVDSETGRTAFTMPFGARAGAGPTPFITGRAGNEQ